MDGPDALRRRLQDAIDLEGEAEKRCAAVRSVLEADPAAASLDGFVRDGEDDDDAIPSGTALHYALRRHSSEVGLRGGACTARPSVITCFRPSLILGRHCPRLRGKGGNYWPGRYLHSSRVLDSGRLPRSSGFVRL